MDLKRGIEPEVFLSRRAAEKNSTTSLSLFDKYQFFTPGMSFFFFEDNTLVNLFKPGTNALLNSKVSS